MTNPSINLKFVKLNVSDMDAALKFYGEAFGFVITKTFDVPDFIEHILAHPDQDDGSQIMLVSFKDGRDIPVGSAHGPIGIVTDDIVTLHAKAEAAGGTTTLPIFDAQGIKVSILTDADGHEVELVQMPAS